MSSVAISITENDLFKVLGDVIASLVDWPVLRAQSGVVLPDGDCILLAGLEDAPLAPADENYLEHGDVRVTRIKQSRKWTARIACRGAEGHDCAVRLSVAFGSASIYRKFQDSGMDISPLFADAAAFPAIPIEEAPAPAQWSFSLILQYNPYIEIPQESASTLAMGLINVDAKFPYGG
ncbi:hypothetical protein [Bordetella sp. LUAb4]|uniref:phage neck terminator protein n=1 Tax=Bordetella sp. LUAb4 TaxID=2843195 RepID=UPI001E3BBC04|nr:hypothetical protein [Bordetella sp. LUAb4]